MLRICTPVALARGTPVLIVCLLLAAVVLGGTGVQASDVADGFVQNRVFRLGAAALWGALWAPALRALFSAPGLDYARSLRPGATAVSAALALPVTLLQLPWLLLFAAGGRPLTGLGSAAAIALGLCMLVVPRSRWGLRGEALLGFSTAAVALWFGGGLLLLAAVALAFSLWRTWLASAEASHGRRRPRVFGGRWVALVCAHGLRMARAEKGPLARALAVSFLAAVFVGLAAANNVFADGAELTRWLVAALCPAAVAACGTLALAVQRSEAALHWVLVSTAVPPRARYLASFACIAGGSALLHGAALGAGVAGAGQGLWPASGVVGGHALAQALLVKELVFWVRRRQESQAGLALVLFIFALGSALFWAAAGGWALAAEMALAGVCLGRSVDGATESRARG